MSSVPTHAVASRAHRTAACLLALLPGLALAHGGNDTGGHHSFAAGFAHPFTGVDHLAAMLAVGAWSAVSAARAQWRAYLGAPLTFVALLGVGALSAWGGMAWPAVEPLVAVSLVVLGLLVAARMALPAAAGAALVGGFALFHGAAHGQELGSAAALAGMLLATVLLHITGLAAGHAARTHSHWWPRAAGAATLLLGAALLALGGSA